MTNARDTLSTQKIDGAALQAIASFHKETVTEVASAVASGGVVVVGMSQNPVVRSARKLLDEAQVPYKYLEYGSYFSQWKKRLAIKLWSGWPTYPQVFVDGILVGGYTDLKAFAAKGGLASKTKPQAN
jgi:glutaredoxin-related protein